jgi:thymidylate kinase
MFLMIDGIAGSGKSTILRAAQAEVKRLGLRVFDLVEWTKTQQAPPSFEDVKDFDVLFTFEPTKQWVGSAIRYELSVTGGLYGGETHAHAFSLDREIQYRRLILPCLKAGKTVIQDRGITTSMVYQPVMKGGISFEKLIELPGNRLALTQVPDVLLLTDLNVQTAMERIKSRSDDGKGIWADPVFLTKVSQRFRSDWFSKFFMDRGTCVHTFDTRGEQAATIARAEALIRGLLAK